LTYDFHWNVTGPMFNTLHQMFMQQYVQQWTALGLIAESFGRSVSGARRLPRVRQVSR